MTLLPENFSHRFHITVPASFDSLAECSVALLEWAQANQLPSRTSFHLDLIVDEVITNLLTHGLAALQEVNARLRPGSAAMLTVTLRVKLVERAHVIRITVSDNGPAFDPRQLPGVDTEAALDARSIGGLGVEFVRQLTTAMRYRRFGNVNVLTLSMLNGSMV